MTNTPAQKMAKERLADCVLIANQKLNTAYSCPTLTFNQRGKIAGSALLHKHQIKLNPILLEDNLDAFLTEIIPHELCHLWVFLAYGRVKPHGVEWQHYMHQLFELPPKTTHNLDVSKVAGQSFDYHCGCSNLKLTVRRHRKVQRQQQQYRCRQCGEILRYGKSEVVKTTAL